jgi:hypothetical protein
LAILLRLMAITHILVGNEASKNLLAAQEQFVGELEGDVIVLKDTLGIGPINTSEQSHDEVRSNFWQQILTNSDVVNEDEATIKNLTNSLQENDAAWFWMAPCVSDVAAYYWLLPYFAKHQGVLHCLSIAGLPFFNEKGILFTPKNFSEVLPKEMLKCKRLALQLSPADYEIDGDEWQRLCGENAQVRSLVGNKKLESKNEHFYDQYILNQLQFSTEFITAHKLVQQATAKAPDTVSDQFIAYRLRTLIEQGKVQVQGDQTKALKDFEIKKLDA